MRRHSFLSLPPYCEPNALISDVQCTNLNRIAHFFNSLTIQFDSLLFSRTPLGHLIVRDTNNYNRRITRLTLQTAAYNLRPTHYHASIAPCLFQGYGHPFYDITQRMWQLGVLFGRASALFHFASIYMLARPFKPLHLVSYSYHTNLLESVHLQLHSAPPATANATATNNCNLQLAGIAML